MATLYNGDETLGGAIMTPESQLVLLRDVLTSQIESECSLASGDRSTLSRVISFQRHCGTSANEVSSATKANFDRYVTRGYPDKTTLALAAKFMAWSCAPVTQTIVLNFLEFYLGYLTTGIKTEFDTLALEEFESVFLQEGVFLKAMLWLRDVQTAVLKDALALDVFKSVAAENWLSEAEFVENVAKQVKRVGENINNLVPQFKVHETMVEFPATRGVEKVEPEHVSELSVGSLLKNYRSLGPELETLKENVSKSFTAMRLVTTQVESFSHSLAARDSTVNNTLHELQTTIRVMNRNQELLAKKLEDIKFHQANTDMVVNEVKGFMEEFKAKGYTSKSSRQYVPVGARGKRAWSYEDGEPKRAKTSAEPELPSELGEPGHDESDESDDEGSKRSRTSSAHSRSVTMREFVNGYRALEDMMAATGTSG